MTRALGLVEAGRLLRSPYPWAAVAVVVGLVTWATRHQQPNLSAAVINAASGTFLVAATLMVLANLAVLRDQRRGMPELLGALPGRADTRTRALLLAAGGVSALLALVVVAGLTVVIGLTPGPVAGVVDGREALAAMIAAAMIAITGVTVGRWIPTPVVIPVFVFGLGLMMTFGGAVLAAWHMPMAVPYEFEAFGRPSGPRLVFLAGAVVALAGLAVLRHGRRRVRLAAVTAGLAVLVAGAVAVAVAAPPMWSRVAPEAARTWDPERVCADRGGISYCHYPGFARWIPLWAEAVEPVAAAVPPAARGQLPTVVQRHHHLAMVAVPRPGEAVVGTSWGRGDAEQESRAELAGMVAAEVTGLTRDRLAGGPTMSFCDGHGQARTVVALWLAGQVGSQSTSPSVWGVRHGEQELAIAETLLDQADGTDLLWEHWDRLLSSEATVDELVTLLGVPPPDWTQPPPAPASGSVPCG